MGVSYKMRLVLLVLGIGVATAGGLIIKSFLQPASFGVYGPFRADAIEEEAAMPIRHATNASCYACHPYEAKIHQVGKHKTISCEFCHGPWADHVAGNKKIGTLPVKKGKEITTLCLRCHNTAITARPHTVIKTVAIPEHLASQKVKLTHSCNQCHHVHAPLKYINRAKQITGLGETAL